MEPDRVLNGSITRVLIAIVLVAFLLPMSGCTTPDDNEDERIVIMLAALEVVKRDAEEIWDATTKINKVTPRESEVKWSGMTVVIKSSDGPVLLQETSLAKDTGSYGTTVEIWYVNIAGDEGIADAEDVIKFTGLDDGYQGAQIQISYKGRTIGDTRLTTDFP